MNKLLTEINGKFPFVLDDLRFLDASYRQAFKAILDGLGMGNENFIISGGDNGDGLFVGGAVYINGEICVTNDQFIDDMNGTKYIDYDISYDAAGLKTFGDAQSHNTYEIRKAKVYNSATPPTGYIPYNIPKMKDLILQTPAPSGWNNVGGVLASFQNGFENYNDYYHPLAFRKTNNRVYIRGQIINPTQNTYGQKIDHLLIFTLPSGMRPTKCIVFPVVIGDDTANFGISLGQIVINADGQVKLFAKEYYYNTMTAEEYHNGDISIGEISFSLD